MFSPVFVAQRLPLEPVSSDHTQQPWLRKCEHALSERWAVSTSHLRQNLACVVHFLAGQLHALYFLQITGLHLPAGGVTIG